MPTYCFRCQSTGEVITEVHPSSDIPERIEVEGKAYVRDVMSEILSQHRQVHEGSGVRPFGDGHRGIRSDALGVLPKQVPEAMADAKRRGVKIGFEPDGTAVFGTRKQQKEYCEAYGYFNRDGGYGDAQPGSGKHLKYKD